MVLLDSKDPPEEPVTSNSSHNSSTRMTITSGGNIGAPSGTNIYNASDARLKQNINSLSDSLNI